MAEPQGGYPPQEEYGQPGDYGAPAQAGMPQGQAAGKKKRAYAGEAFAFGSGANAALGGQMPAGGGYPQYPPQPVAGYQQPMAQPQVQPMYGVDPAAQMQQPMAQGYVPPAAPGVAQMTQQFGAMGMADPHQMPPQAAQAPRPVPLNQLYPTDLLTQPFNVAELDLPPPPIVLPPGVRIENNPDRNPCLVVTGWLLTSLFYRPVFTRLLMRTVPRSTCGRR